LAWVSLELAAQAHNVRAQHAHGIVVCRPEGGAQELAVRHDTPGVLCKRPQESRTRSGVRCTSRGSGWRLKASVNGVSAVVTAMVALFAAVTNIMNPALPIVLGLPIGWARGSCC